MIESRLAGSKKREPLFHGAVQNAGVAELADAPDLGSGVPHVQVQVLSPAPKTKDALAASFVFALMDGRT